MGTAVIGVMIQTVISVKQSYNVSVLWGSATHRRDPPSNIDVCRLTGGVSVTLKYKFIPKMLPAIATNATATVTMLKTCTAPRTVTVSIITFTMLPLIASCPFVHVGQQVAGTAWGTEGLRQGDMLNLVAKPHDPFATKIAFCSHA